MPLTPKADQALAYWNYDESRLDGLLKFYELALESPLLEYDQAHAVDAVPYDDLADLVHCARKLLEAVTTECATP